MGIENRDYYNSPPNYSGSDGWLGDYIPPTCKYLIAINVIVFLMAIASTAKPTAEQIQAKQAELTKQAQADGTAELSDDFHVLYEDAAIFLMMENQSTIEQWLRLDTAKLAESFQVWRLITYAFCHDRHDLFGLVFGMVLLWYVGKSIETIYGSIEFLLFFLAAVIFSALSYVVMEFTTGQAEPFSGTVGGIMATVMLYAFWYPRQTIHVFIIDIEVRWLVLLYLVFELHPMLMVLMGDPLYNGVNEAAPVGGIAFAWLYWRQSWQFAPWFDAAFRKSSAAPTASTSTNRSTTQTTKRSTTQTTKRSSTQSARTFSENDRSTDPLEEQVDRILEKIGTDGMESLSDAERETLERATQVYNQRT